MGVQVLIDPTAAYRHVNAAHIRASPEIEVSQRLHGCPILIYRLHGFAAVAAVACSGSIGCMQRLHGFAAVAWSYLPCSTPL